MKTNHNKILWITQTAVMLALLITLQWATSFIPKPMGQIITGSCVNAVLAITALVVGYSSGITVAVISPVVAFLLGIAENVVTVPAIMAGNVVFVIMLRALAGESAKPIWRQPLAVVVAAAVKFLALYLLVTKVICGLLSQELMSQGLLKAPMLTKLPVAFTWPQLITALIGGSLAMVITPRLRK